MKYILTHIDNSKLNLHTRTPYSSVLEASVSNIWQGYNELTLKVSVEGVPGWRHFDKIQIDDIDYYLNEWNESEHVDERVSTYTLHFYGPEKMIIEASPLTDMDEDGVSVFRKLTSVTGDLPFFGNMICNCINYRHYDPQTGLRVKQNTAKLGTYPAGTKHLNVDFSESNAFAGLKAICEKFGVSYSLERNIQGDTDYILNFETEQTVFPVTLSYGKGKGLYAIRRKSLNTKNIKTILTVLGSSKNLPTDYGKNNLELDPTLYPGSIIADADKIAKYGAWNEIYQNEEIIPSRLGAITAIDEADVLSFFDNTLTFDPTGGTVNVVTGQLAGNNFKIRKYNAITHKITVEPLTDENGFTKPSVAPFLFAPGDEYYLVDIPMPGSYLIAAQEELAEAGNAEYDRISQPQVAYEVSLHGKFLRKHEVRPRVGMYLPISDVRWGVDKAILITKVKRDLLKRDDWEYECEISDDPGESLAVCLYKKIQQTGINTRKQEKNQISTIAALRSFAEEKASESLMASEVYAAAQAEAARIAAEAYADGEINAEEARAIADATAKMNEAKSYALAQAAAAETAAKTYAEAQAAAAQAAAEAVAEAEALAAQTAAEAHADGIVTAEEAARIADVNAKLATAKTYAETKATEAKNAAEAAAEATAAALDDAIQVGGRNLILNSLNRINLLSNASSIYPIQDQAVSGENYRRFRRTYPEGITDNRISTYTSEFFTPEKSGYYTYSTYFRPNEFDIELRMRWFDSIYGTYTLCKANEWTQLSVTAWIEAGVATRLSAVHGFMPPEAVQWIDYNRVSVTSGNKPTDWTPAPEDVQAEIDDVSTGLTNLGAEINTAFSNLSITNIEANNLDLLRKSLAKEVADVRAIAVSMSVSVVDLDSKISALNTEVNKYAGKADSVYPITVTVANRTAIDTAFSNLEASIVALYEAIDKKRVDDIEVGGRNYIVLHTSIPNTYIHKDTGLPSPSSVGAVSTDWIEVEPSTTYTWTVLPDSAGLNTDIGFFDENKTFIIRDRQTNSVVEPVVYNFTTTASTKFLRISHKNLGGAKLEKGSKATDWTPAPEDVQAEIDAADAAAAAAQSTANAAATAAAAAQSTANAASTAAAAAQTSANTANNLLSDIANDNKLTPLEKQETKKEWDAIVSEKTKNDSQADTFGVSKTAYGTAYNALNTYITPLLSSLTTTSNITGTTFRSTFKAYYDARTDLLNAIAAKARTLANTAQTTANNAATAAAAAVTTAASDATAKMNAAKDAIAQEAGYTNFADMASKAALTVNGLLNSQIINVDDLFANTAFISKLLLEDGFIENLTVKFLETVGDANGYKVQIKNSLNSEGTGESYVRLVNSDGTRKAELVFDANNVYGGSGGLPVLRITDNGCYSRVFAEGLEAVSTTSGRFSYNMLSQFTPFGMTFATGTHASAAVKGGFKWDRNDGKVLIYVNTLPRGGFGTVSEGFLYRSPDGLSNDVIRYQS